VQIEGDVRAGASIYAEGDVVVKGMCELSNIDCEGKLSVSGGILGSEDFTITTGGGVLAKYISEAIVHSNGDIIVNNEIAHAQVETRGRVLISKGRIAGGKIVARQGIKVGEAGASGSSDTVLVAGVDPTLAPKIANHRDKILQFEEGRDKIIAAISKATKNPKSLDEAKRQLFAGLQKKAEYLEEAIKEEEQIIQKETQAAMSDAVEEVVILAELWSGTTIQLGKFQTIIRSSIMKPRIAHRKKSKVIILPLGEGNMPEE